MLKYNIKELRELYNRGVNITVELQNRLHSQENSLEAIRLAYDFQAGTYVEHYLSNKEYCHKVSDIVSDKIKACFPDAKSVLDVGCGELTGTMSLYKKLCNFDYFYGCDLSLSRLFVGRKFLRDNDFEDTKIRCYTGSMTHLPHPDNSIDLIISQHALEPNRGRELDILKELLRVARCGLLLMEPDYKNACSEQKRRMDKLGYVNRLEESFEQLGVGFDISPMDIWDDVLNKASLFSVFKQNKTEVGAPPKDFIDPISKTALIKNSNYYFSIDQGLLYPIVKKIPVFDATNSVVCTKYLDF